MNNSYKLYQLMSFFLAKFSYKILNVSSQKQDEMFLINPTHEFYPLIRITTKSIEQVIFEKDRLHTIVNDLFKGFRIKKGRLLDIHVTHDEILDNEEFDSIALESNYYSGPDLSDIYPGIRNVVHESKDPMLEISDITSELAMMAKVQKSQKRKVKFSGKPLVTYITIVICIIFYILALLLQRDYKQIDSLIVLGANYKTFTVGLYEVWRLITCGFLHSGIWHLLFNMISLYSLGNIIERQIGSLKFAFVLYGSLIVSSLTSLLFNDNGVTVGISGAIYGIFGLYLIDAFYKRTLRNGYALQIILINLFINFLGGVDIMAHVGGLVAGVTFYFFINNKNSIFLYLMILFVLVVRVFFINNSYTVYAGTDMSVVEIYEDLGFVNHANNLSERLIEVWSENQ